MDIRNKHINAFLFLEVKIQQGITNWEVFPVQCKEIKAIKNVARTDTTSFANVFTSDYVIYP